MQSSARGCMHGNECILHRYPFVHIALHKGYGHCQYMAAEEKAYRAMLEERIKESV